MNAFGLGSWQGLAHPKCCHVFRHARGHVHALSRHSVLPQRAVAARSTPRLREVLQEIDRRNSEDTRTVVVDGEEVPYELQYSRWLTNWVKKLTEDGNPPASEELLIVARGQHIRRWTSPRTSYPDGKAGYLKWREDLKRFHAKEVTSIMGQAGYPAESLVKVDAMINKKNLLKDAEHQTIEDALCLVFLERQFAEFRLKEDEDKLVDILRKTWKKMGVKGREAALALPLQPSEAALVSKALAA